MNTNLPIFTKYEDIVKSVRENDITIISSETGSGKSTQVPQYLYDAGYKIICTQPRRMACVSLAERVNEEMRDYSWSKYCDRVVGYQTAFESTRTPDTKILFCTDGLQVASGIDDEENTVLIIDEIHEFNLNIEVMIAWIKNELKNGLKTKIVLMSATIDISRLVDYYSEFKVGVVSIEVPTFNVTVSESSHGDAIRVATDSAKMGKNCLVFVSGKAEIEDFINKLTSSCKDIDVIILPLHGEMSIQDQRKIFEKYSVPKIIVSTNIAQTSVTIPDIDVVIDMGLEKRIEVRNGIEGLYERETSKSDCIQRKGRTGRTHDGEYYLFGTPMKYRERIQKPEIQRLPLDKIVLKLLSFGLNARDLEFFHQPDIEDIEKSENLLKFLEAIDKNGNITEIGKRMDKLPFSSRLSRVIIEAENTGDNKILTSCIILSSIMEYGPVLGFKKDKYGINICTYRRVFSENDWSYGCEFPNDLVADYTLFTMVRNNEISEYSMGYINLKKYNNVNNVVNKICKLLDVDNEGFDPVEVWNEDVLKCLIAGNLDRIFIRTQFDECIGLFNDQFYDFVISNRTEYEVSGDIIIGVPITIEYKGYAGMKNTKNIINFPFEIGEEYIIDSLADFCEKEYDYYSAELIDAYEETFEVPVIYMINGRDFYSTTEIMKNEELSRICRLDILKAKYKTIRIGDFNQDFPVYFDYKKDKIIAAVNINKLFTSIIKQEEIDNIDGDVEVYFRFDSKLFKKLSEAKYYIEEYERRNKYNGKHNDFIKELKSSCKMAGNINKIIKYIIPEVREKRKEILERNIQDVFYGLKHVSGNTIMEFVFYDKSRCEEETKNALKIVFDNYIKTTYTKKRFKERLSDGKREFTKRSESAMNSVLNFAEMALEDLTLENFSDIIDMVESIKKRLNIVK